MINNLVLSRVPAGDINEGSSVALTIGWTNAAAANHIIVIDWGNGQAEGHDITSAPPTYSKTYNHTYSTHGSYDIVVDVTAGTDGAIAGATIDVLSTAPVITSAIGDCDNETGEIDVDFIFTDSGLPGFAATIGWGDGSSDSWSISVSGTYSRSHIYTSFPTGSLSHRRRINLQIADQDGNIGTALFYPSMGFNDDVDDIGIGTADAYGIVEYHDEVDKTGFGNTFFEGIPFYSFDADGSGSASTIAAAALDYASVLIIEDTAECSQVGNVPFEQLVPPE